MTDTITLPRSVVEQALEALEMMGVPSPLVFMPDEIKAWQNAQKGIRAALEQPQVEQEPDGLSLVIAGAIYDFAGYITTRPKVIEVGSTANASPMADLVKEFAELRGLSLADAAVLSWQMRRCFRGRCG